MLLAKEPPSREEKGMWDAGCGLRRQNNFPRTRTSEPATRRFGSRGEKWGGGAGGWRVPFPRAHPVLSSQ